MITGQAAIDTSSPEHWVFSGTWTALGLSPISKQLVTLAAMNSRTRTIDTSHIEALDTAGAWVLEKLLKNLSDADRQAAVRGLHPALARRMEAVVRRATETHPISTPRDSSHLSTLERIGRATWPILLETIGLVGFVGQVAKSFVDCVRHPARLRVRSILFNIRVAGFDALPIVGILAFLLGVVVAFQGADQLRQYGANLYVADLVGVSMLREFAPLITAIIIAGRSGSAYAAQIGTMAVTEEIDAMRTLGMRPQEVLVLPKVIALIIALPLLTVAADAMGVLGGMLSARAELDVSFTEFIDRLAKAIGNTTFLVGIGKAPVFAAIIAIVGCFQGFRTHGGAESVGRQTTRSVVQAIFLVIVADGLFSVVFTALDI